MILKWIQSITQSQPKAESIQQAASEQEKAKAETKRDTKLVDVAHEVMRKDKENLDGLVRLGLPKAQLEQFKGKVKKKVWDVMSSELGSVDPDMVEEITERVVDAAEFDPYYKKMFDQDNREE